MEGLTQAKWLIRDVPPSGWVRAAGQLDRRRLRLAVGWLTGHWRVGHHLSGMRLARNGNCRWCEDEPETTRHLFCECPRWLDLRRRKLGQPVVDGPALWGCSLSAICSMAGSIDVSLGERELDGTGGARPIRARAAGRGRGVPDRR